ncbi:MAG: ADOP family duplicated permease [Gemmatimonadaceae bacterium]
MRNDPVWRRYTRFWGTNVDADIDDEMRFHLETRVEELVERGLTSHAARAQALEEYGDVAMIRKQLREIDRRAHGRRESAERWDALVRDVRFAARTLRRSPAFAAMAIVCVALGVCVTTTIFSAVHGILIRPLPYERADELVSVYAQNPGREIRGSNVSYPDYVSWRDANRTFAALALWTWSSHAFSGDGGEAERVEGASITANLLPILGVRPMLGRQFLPEEHQDGRDNVVLLGYGLWQRRFGGDRSVVGRTITVNGRPHTVVGVMPPRFNFPERGEAWVPFGAPAWATEQRSSRQYAGALGRLKPGVRLEQAGADLDRISAELQRAYPRENTGWSAQLVPIRDDLVRDLRRPLLVFAGAVALVLLIACANVANLMLARASTRQREIAIRVAVGAGRGRLVRQVLTESLVLAAAGGALGAGLSYFGVRLLRLAFPESLPFYISLELDRPALAFAVLATTLAGVLVGIAPAVRATRVDLTASLKEGGRGSGAGASRSRMRATLVVAEVALSVVLMIGAMLLIRSYRALEGTDLGFDEHGMLSMRISLPTVKYDNHARVSAFYDRLLARIRAMPGVESVGAAQGAPFSGWNVHNRLTIEGRPPAGPGEELLTHFQLITPDYLRAIGVPIVRGRGLLASDRDSLAPVGVVNETFVKQILRGADPIGKRVKLGSPDAPSPWVTIVGVMRDYRHYRLPQPMDAAIFLPYAVEPVPSQTLAIRTSLPDPHALVPAVRNAIRELDPSVPAFRIQTFEEVVSRSLWRQRLQGEVLGVFAALALLLASVGLYGVIAYAVAQRTRELGVRMALGATRRHVLGLVLGQGARLTLIGVVLGAAGALALSRVIASLLYGVKPTDPFTFLAVPTALAAVALLASYVPARRAMEVDPLVAMRAE